MSGERDNLRHRADQARDRLMVTLDALDRRRHELFDVRKQIQRHPAAAASLSAGAVAMLGLLGFVIWRVSRKEQHVWRERAHALQRAWQHPHRLASSKQAPFGAELGRRVLLGLAAFFAIELGKRGIGRLLAARTE